ncbi:MAG: peptidase MA family metallohydrolase, partial [Tepidisphaeraceae bacterium]
EVTADFKHEPARKTLVEVFPTIDQFSVRTAGMPGAETFGASFGPVITAVAPRTGETMGRFHWARVLRHEFTHVMNMSQTEHRCPRWLTEGLAVWQEKVPFRFEWVPPALYRAATTDEMFTIDGLREAFVRPRRPTDGEMGYMQGFWVTEYLREKYGPDSIVRLLECFKQGMDDFDAFRATTGKSAAEFEREYHAWAKERVKDWGYDQETAKKYKDVTERAEEHTKARQDDEGLKLWQEANKLQPFSSLPHRRLAGLYLRQKQIREAIPHLEALIPIELKDNRYAVRIARLYRDIDDVPNAQRYAMTAVYIDPYDPVAHELLAELYERAGGREAQAKREREVAALLKERQTAAPKGSPDGE